MVLKMKYDSKYFDQVIERRGHDAVKWDKPLFVTDNKDIVPMWVADMDFATPECIVDAMKKRLEHPTFGYYGMPDAYFEGVAAWQAKRYGVEGVKPENIDYHNGVLGGVSSFIEAFTLPGDNILINDTCYTGFQSTIANRGRNLLYSPLKETADGWALDLEDMEQKIIASKPPVMIFCNPHNPTGHVWTPEEMKATVELCDKYGMLICSDEIWADFQTGGHKHTPLHTCSPRAKEIVYSMYAPSKTFNLAGLQGSYSVCWNQAMRARINKAAAASHYNAANILSVHAAIGAYTGDEGAQYVDAMNAYIRESQIWLKKELEENLPGIRIHLPDATYLLWVNFEDYCKTKGCDFQTVLDKVTEKGVIPNDGRTFHGATHLRFNLACPFSQVQECAKRVIEALK